jgi:hypothetical protein
VFTPDSCRQWALGRKAGRQRRTHPHEVQYRGEHLPDVFERALLHHRQQGRDVDTCPFLVLQSEFFQLERCFRSGLRARVVVFDLDRAEEFEGEDDRRRRGIYRLNLLR